MYNAGITCLIQRLTKICCIQKAMFIGYFIPQLLRRQYKRLPTFKFSMLNMNKNFSLTENQGVFKEFFEKCKFQEHFKRP